MREMSENRKPELFWPLYTKGVLYKVALLMLDSFKIFKIGYPEG